MTTLTIKRNTVAAAMATLLLASAFAARAEDIVPPKPVPALQGKTTAGKKLDLAKLLKSRKPKETWVLFWASWCPPCAFELPELEKLWKELRGKGFEVVTVNEEAMSPDMAWAKGLPDYVKMMKISYPVIDDNDGKLADAWGVEGRLPTLYRVNEKGEIIARELGFSEDVFRVREKGLKERLGVIEKTETAPPAHKPLEEKPAAEKASGAKSPEAKPAEARPAEKQ